MHEERSKPEPILVAGLFTEIRSNLIELLEGLSPEDWSKPTAAPLWSVKDIALHLLGGDISNLSRRRDEFRPPGEAISSYSELVAFINSINEKWVLAGRRLSTRLLCNLLQFTGPQLAEYFASLDPFETGDPVSWAGPEPAPVWLDVAREYTEQWHHQQQIRDATGRLPLYSERLFAPVLDTFMRATPHNYRDTEAATGTAVSIRIEGEAGGTWLLEKSGEGWILLLDGPLRPTAEISIPQDTAWRLFTKGLTPAAGKAIATFSGNPYLIEPFFGTVAVLA